jgi:putative nucleotidyltransferase with HDIG domain
MSNMLNQEQRYIFSTDFRRRLESAIELPPLPEVARELLMLRDANNADAESLINVVGRDAPVAAQLLSYSRLSLFGYGDRIQTLDDGVMLVLGYDKALHMAIGLAAGKSLQMQPDGPLGRQAFWQHSLQMATLTQALAMVLPPAQRPDPGICYLAGLLHDIGYMLFGHLYPDEFAMLNQLVNEYPDREVRELELAGFGISHDMIGRWLMQSWGMPEKIVVAVGEHCFFDYDGKHAIYPKLVAFANQLLKIEHNESALAGNRDLILVNALELDDQRVQRALDRVLTISASLEVMARELAA